MQTPPRSQHKRSHMDIDDGKAEVSVHRHEGHTTHKVSKFARLVNKIVEGEKVIGHYKKVYMLTLAARYDNQWSITSTDDLGTGLHFDNPLKHKDAEAVLFNSKVPLKDSWGTATITATPGDGKNFPVYQPTTILNSQVTFRFVNQSQQRMFCEMYIFRAKKEIYTDPKATAKNLEVFIREFGLPNTLGKTYPTNYGATGNFPQYYLGGNFTDIPGLSEAFQMEKITMRMDPGELAFHKVQGVRGFTFTGAQKVLDAGYYKSCYVPGNGFMVLFRTMCDLSLFSTTGTPLSNRADPTVTAADSTTNTNANNIQVWPYRPKNVLTVASGQNSGAILCEIHEQFKVQCPESAPYAQNQLVLANYIHDVNDGVSTRTTIDYRNPATTGSTDV